MIDILSGILVIFGGIILKVFFKYYEEKRLPCESLKEQSNYWKEEHDLSRKGAYNVPFNNCEGNTKHDLYNFIIVAGIVLLFLGLIEILNN